MKPSAWGYNWVILFLGNTNKALGPAGRGILESQKNIVVSPTGLEPEHDCNGEAQQQL
jgi:hypothetical protein